MSEPTRTGVPDPVLPGADGPVGDAEPEQGFLRELSQFFIVPSLIVLLCVGVFIMFGLLSSENKSARDFLQEVRTRRGGDRWQAAFELSRAIGKQPERGADPRLMADIISALHQEGREDPQVRKYLIIALERLGSPEGGPAIIEALGDSDPEVRLHAARALGTLGDVAGAAGPLTGLLDDEDPAIRKVAIHALGRTHDPAAIPALLPLLEDPAEEIRWNAALALAVLGDGSGVGVISRMIDRSHLDKVEGITEDQKVSAMVNGIQAIYLLKDASFSARLRELGEKDPSLNVREIALKAAESLGPR
ncbi:MAG TPA: HEAT repeat domain-containing protein [Candidatus Polarisedimenticolia bacterium]|jgi:HEAT repeat protein